MQLFYLDVNQLQILWTEINGLCKSLNSTPLRCLLLIYAMAFGIWLIPHSTRHQLHCDLEAYYCLILLSSLHGIKIERLFCCICMFKGLLSKVLSFMITYCKSQLLSPWWLLKKRMSYVRHQAMKMVNDVAHFHGYLIFKEATNSVSIPLKFYDLL